MEGFFIVDRLYSEREEAKLFIYRHFGGSNIPERRGLTYVEVPCCENQGMFKVFPDSPLNLGLLVLFLAHLP